MDLAHFIVNNFLDAGNPKEGMIGTNGDKVLVVRDLFILPEKDLLWFFWTGEQKEDEVFSDMDVVLVRNGNPLQPLLYTVTSKRISEAVQAVWGEVTCERIDLFKQDAVAVGEEIRKHVPNCCT